MNWIVSLLLMFLSASAYAQNYIVLFNGNSKPITIEEQKKETESKIASLQEYALYSIQSFFKLPSSIQPQKLLWAINGFSAELDQQQLDELQSSGLVAGVFVDGKKHILGEVSGTRIEAPTAKYTYGLVNTGVVALREQHPEITGKGVVVGVIDTGVDGTHPDLAGKVVGFKDFINNKDQPYDDQGHGTHVSGTIAGGNASGMAIGVAPGAKLIVAKVFSSDGSANDSDILSAMQWMLEQHPSVVSNSWGGGQPDDKVLENVPFVKMVDVWVQAGIFPSFAAGNEGNGPETMSIPGGQPDAFAVGAVDDKNEVAMFSSRGPIHWSIGGVMKEFVKPDVVAPGMNVYSSIPGGQYASYSGTSMATPHVSGLVALIKQVHPEYTVAQVEQAILATAHGLGAPNDYGKGIIDAKACLWQGNALPVWAATF
jgi:serine protease AprX